MSKRFSKGRVYLSLQRTLRRSNVGQAVSKCSRMIIVARECIRMGEHMSCRHPVKVGGDRSRAS